MDMAQASIIKTKLSNPKSYQPLMGVREIAEQIWGKLKVADSFLYLYRRFGKPTYDTNDEYKISYEYQFCYNGLFFSIFGTTPDFVYLDCYIPNRLANEGWKRFTTKEKAIAEKALAEGVLYFPAPYYDGTSLGKKQQEPWNALYDEKFGQMFDKEVIRVLNEKPFSELTKNMQEEYLKKYYSPFFSKMAKDFSEWAKTNAPEFQYKYILLENLPEVKETVVSFCKKMLKVETIRDCGINIRGWQ